MVSRMFQTTHLGVVRDFDPRHGRGIIETADGDSVTVRYSAILGKGLRTLRSGDRVRFEVENTTRGLAAIHVTRD